MTASIRAIARQVYDQDSHSAADFAFLAAVETADREWTEALDSANRTFGGGSSAWRAVKNLATRQRDADYARALAVFEAGDDEPAELPPSNIVEIKVRNPSVPEPLRTILNSFAGGFGR